MYMYYYYPIGSTTPSWYGAFSFKPTTEWKIFYAIVNIPNDKYMYDNTISFCNHGDGTTYYIDWMAAYDVTGLNFDHMTFGANATVYSSDVVKGKSFYKDGVLYTGSMVSYTKEETTKSLGRTTTSYTIPAGKHSGSGTVSLNIDSTYNYATPQKDTKTYYPGGTSPTDQVFTSFRVAGDSNLVASNIKNGVSIFGVQGNYQGSAVSTAGYIEDCGEIRPSYTGEFSFSFSGNKNNIIGFCVTCVNTLTPSNENDEYITSIFVNGTSLYITAVYSNGKSYSYTEEDVSFAVSSSKVTFNIENG